MPEENESTEEMSEDEKKAVSDLLKKKESEKKEKNETQETKETLNALEIEALQKKKAELEDIEKRVDKKMAVLKEFAEEARKEGKGFSLPQKKPTEEEQQKNTANKILNQFGYSI